MKGAAAKKRRLSGARDLGRAFYSLLFGWCIQSAGPQQLRAAPVKIIRELKGKQKVSDFRWFEMICQNLSKQQRSLSLQSMWRSPKTGRTSVGFGFMVTRNPPRFSIEEVWPLLSHEILQRLPVLFSWICLNSAWNMEALVSGMQFFEEIGPVAMPGFNMLRPEMYEKLNSLPTRSRVWSSEEIRIDGMGCDGIMLRWCWDEMCWVIFPLFLWAAWWIHDPRPTVTSHVSSL